MAAANNVLHSDVGATNGAPLHNLVLQDILTIQVDAIVVSTDFNMRNDMMERQSRHHGSRMLRWYNSTFAAGVSVTDAWNRANSGVAGAGLVAGTCREAPSGLQHLLSASFSQLQS